MEFRFRSEEERLSSLTEVPPPPPPSSSSPSFSSFASYFTRQAMRAGLIGFRGGPMQPMTAMEALEREIRKERIREEILREEAERRILEAEVRRELEMERMFGVRRTMPPPEERMEPFPVPFGPDARVRFRDALEFRSTGRCSEDRSDPKKLCLEAPQRTREEKESPLATKKLELQIIESPESSEVPPQNSKLSGTKRKAELDSEVSKKLQKQPIKKDWSCAICEVCVTSESALNEHLQGKKHKAKLVLSGAVKKFNNNDKSILKKPKAEVLAKAEGSSAAEGEKKISMQVDGKMYTVLQKKDCLWCEKCKVKCLSSINMAVHLGGKKHNSSTENLNKAQARKLARAATKVKSKENAEKPIKEDAKENGAEEDKETAEEGGEQAK
uniref:C2H2-type domain-containing protein n=1 Tax=Ananas comosus var. bracteatus TaxID=296719 RepID=A0A6V7QBH1_ANACO|nr:unnamed protein product [Ananas comosus var. bracteatus]